VQGGEFTEGKAMNGKLIVILIASISMIACTTMRTIDREKYELTEKLEVGDHLVVYETTGRIVDMKLDSIEGDYLQGTSTDGYPTMVDVNINDIEKIEVEKIDGVRTTLAVVGGAIIIVPLVIIAALTGVMFQQ